MSRMAVGFLIQGSMEPTLLLVMRMDAPFAPKLSLKDIPHLTTYFTD